ncbi:probable RNA-directed DNA polymerase from transposon X-element [Trichonephila clavipes]|nr:probable RNA-directed DNA polymerase from transposon X-element [Trichonephila clavipes]
MCKHFTRSVIFQLTNIINNILTVGYFPNIWKTASVIPILKPGKDPTLPDSFRPISLLPVLSKITEKLIQKRLCQHLNDNDILIPQQHGFRAGLSTSHQLLRVVEYIKTGFRDRKSTGAVFLDIQKAFDRIKLKTCTRLLSTNRNRASRPIVKRALGSPRHPNSIPMDTPTP